MSRSDQVEPIEFLIGLALGVLLTFVLFFNMDKSYDLLKYKLDQQEISCNKLGSSPKSFDIGEYTCENGVTITFEEKEQ